MKYQDFINAVSEKAREQGHFFVQDALSRVVFDDRVSTMATNATNIFVNPKWIDHLTTDEIVGVLCHELMHDIYKHDKARWAVYDRASKISQSQWHTLCNVAMDVVINDVILSLGLQLPKEGVFRKDLDIPANMHTSHAIFKKLLADLQAKRNEQALQQAMQQMTQEQQDNDTVKSDTNQTPSSNGYPKGSPQAAKSKKNKKQDSDQDSVDDSDSQDEQDGANGQGSSSQSDDQSSQSDSDGEDTDESDSDSNTSSNTSDAQEQLDKEKEELEKAIQEHNKKKEELEKKKQQRQEELDNQNNKESDNGSGSQNEEDSTIDDELQQEEEELNKEAEQLQQQADDLKKRQEELDNQNNKESDGEKSDNDSDSASSDSTDSTDDDSSDDESEDADNDNSSDSGDETDANDGSSSNSDNDSDTDEEDTTDSDSTSSGDDSDADDGSESDSDDSSDTEDDSDSSDDSSSSDDTDQTDNTSDTDGESDDLSDSSDDGGDSSTTSNGVGGSDDRTLDDVRQAMREIFDSEISDSLYQEEKAPVVHKPVLPPKQSWVDITFQWAGKYLANSERQRTFQRPSRRPSWGFPDSDLKTPFKGSRTGDYKPRAWFYIDVSGSMYYTSRMQFIDRPNLIREELLRHIHILRDTQSLVVPFASSLYQPIDVTMTIPRLGGGTSIEKVIAHINQNKNKFDIFVIVTDCDTTFSTDDIDSKKQVVIVTNQISEVQGSARPNLKVIGVDEF